jgi:hypothetical protein
MREGLADHVWQKRGIKPQAAYDPALVESDQIGGVIVVVGIHLASVGTPEVVPSSLLDENLVPEAEILVESLRIEGFVVFCDHLN